MESAIFETQIPLLVESDDILTFKSHKAHRCTVACGILITSEIRSHSWGLGCVCVCEGELGVGEWGVGISGKLFR